MSLPEEPILPQDPAPVEPPPPVSRARRRRAARAAMFPADAEGQAALVASLSRRAYPSLELFVFALVCGILLGFGYLIDAQAILLLGLLVAPLMTPWVGLLLSVYTGSRRFFVETFIALLISGLMVFLTGLLTGFAARLFLPLTLNNVFVHARLWYPDLLVLSIGAVTLVASFARSEDKPFLPSILVAYAFYLPLSASGFGLGAALQGVWLEGLLVFVVHFALASLLGLATLFILRLKPTKAGGIFSGVALLGLTALLVYLMYPQAMRSVSAAPTPQPSATATLPLPPSFTATASPAPTTTPTNTPLPSPTPSATPLPTEGTPAPSVTPPLETETALPSATPTANPVPAALVTFTPSPSPAPQVVYGVINAGESGGANLRQVPKGKYITTLPNGAVVEVSSEKRVVDGVEWARVFATVDGNRLEGWLLASVIEYTGVTPSP